MLGRNSYEPEELEHARAVVKQQLAAYRNVASAAGADAVADLGPTYFNAMVLVLDRYFVHRVRNVSGKDGNPLNEVELLADSLIYNDARLKASTVIKYVPAKSVLGLEVGDEIRLSDSDFESLSSAFLDELARRFVS